MPTLQELRDQRAAAWTEVQTYNERDARGDAMTGEEETAWERGLETVNELTRQISNREQTAALDKRDAEIDAATTPPAGGDGGSVDDYRAAFRTWMARGMTGLNDEQRALVESSMVDLTGSGQQRALGTSPGSAGGYTVPEAFWAKVTEAMKYFGGAANGCEIITTTGGNEIPWATNDDTANEGYYIGENVELTNEGDLSFGQKRLSAFILASGPARVSLPVINDAAIDVEALVARKIGERIARRKTRALTNGTGANQPQGQMTALTTGKTTASSTAITIDELIDLIHSVDASYRSTGRCRWKLHDLILNKVRKVRDDSGGSGLGRPIWEPSIQAGVPDLLLGYGYDINNDMDSTLATTKKTMAFGDWTSAYVIRNVAGGQMMRLAERYAEYLQVGFIAYERHDALVQDAGAAKVLVQV